MSVGQQNPICFPSQPHGRTGLDVLAKQQDTKPAPTTNKRSSNRGGGAWGGGVSYTDTAQPDLSSFHTRSHACCFQFFELCLSFFLSLYGRGNIFFTAREEAGRVRVLTPSFRANEFVLFPPDSFPLCCRAPAPPVLVLFYGVGGFWYTLKSKKKKNRSLRTLWEWWGMGGAGRDSEMKQQPSYPTLFRPG